MKTIIATLLLLIFNIVAYSQNCGQVIDFNYTITNNNNSTSTYDFWVTIQATSGGSKSVRLTIKCNNNTFISNKCEASYATTRVIHYGPFTVPTCTNDVQLLWSGHTNAACGGTTCYPLQAFFSMPVELTSFEVKNIAGKAALAWKTAAELNNDRFVVERSHNGTDYEPIGEVRGNGTTNEPNAYSFVDEQPLPGTNYYRLKQMDLDGEFEYSAVSSVHFNKAAEIMVYPTIIKAEINVSIPEDLTEENTNITIFNMQGSKVYEAILQGNSAHTLSLPAIHPGQYFVSIGNGQFKKRMIVFKQ